MNINEKLTQILNASPSPTPGVIWYKVTAKQSAPKPYGVFQLAADQRIQIQDLEDANDTRRWHYQFTVWGPDHTQNWNAVRLLEPLFAAYKDYPSDGIQTMIELDQHDAWDDTERLFGAVIEFLIWENLPKP